MTEPLRLAFLGCGYITRVHSRNLRSLKRDIVCSYASRDRAKADAYRRRYGGVQAYDSYTAAIEDPRVEAVVIAVPPRFHLDLTLEALAAGKPAIVPRFAEAASPEAQDFLLDLGAAAEYAESESALAERLSLHMTGMAPKRSESTWQAEVAPVLVNWLGNADGRASQRVRQALLAIER